MKEYFVIKNGRVVYAPGHYDLEGAQAVVRATLQTQMLSATIHIVKIVESYDGETKEKR